MRICFVSGGTANGFSENYGGTEADVLFFGFDGLGEVDYRKELKGETAYFEDVALLSKTCKNVVVCGCITDTYGFKRKSAVVAERGKILGVSDMLNAVDGETSSGAGLRVYDTAAGRLGVAVAEDLCFPEILRTLAVCGSDYILCPFPRITGYAELLLSRAGAFSYGLPIAVCGIGYGWIADVTGDLLFASPLSPIEYSFEKKQEYHLIETRRRGFYRTPREY